MSFPYPKEIWIYDRECAGVIHWLSVIHMWDDYLFLREDSFNPLCEDALDATMVMDRIAVQFYNMLSEFRERKVAKDNQLVVNDIKKLVNNNLSMFLELNRPQKRLATMRFLSGVPTRNRVGNLTHKRFLRSFLPHELLSMAVILFYDRARDLIIRNIIQAKGEIGIVYPNALNAGPIRVGTKYSELPGWHFGEIEQKLPSSHWNIFNS